MNNRKAPWARSAKSNARVRLAVGMCCWMAFLVPALGQIQPVWTRNYDTGRRDGSADLAVDGQGNACLLVDSAGDFSAIKYSPDGTLLWTDTYDSSREDIPASLALDGLGNLWVTGVSRTNDLPGNIVTIKYAPNGNRLWVRTDQETNTIARSPLVILDPAGSGFVVGTSATNNGSFAIIKYDPNGVPLWVNHYAVPSGFRIQSTYAAIDKEGNVIVVGSIRNGIDPTRLVLLRYDPSGNLLSAVFNDWETSSDFLTGVTADPDGNVYVAGAVYHSAPWRRYHYFTAKYSPTGALSWFVLHPPADGYHALPRAVKLDSAGNVVVTGYETRPIDEDDDTHSALTIKYTPDGTQLWSARSTFQRIPQTLAADADGNIYVAGATMPYYSPYGTFLLKYDPNGSQAWYTELPSTRFEKFALAASGEIFVSDNIYTNTTGQMETRKFVQTSLAGQPAATIVPALTEVFAGSSVTLTSVVSGPGPFTYKWLHYGYGTAGTGATFTITNVQYEYFSQGDFSVIVSNANGYTISPEARVTVLRPPQVSLQSTNQYVSTGERATFIANAIGTEPFSFQWYFNKTPISGAVSNVLSIPSVRVTDAGNYYLIVTSRAGAATSTVARLVIVLPPVSLANSSAIQLDSTNVTPYPSEIAVQGVTGNVVKVRVTLCGLTHANPYDVRVLLQGPLGQSVMLMSGVSEEEAANNVTLTFDDDAYGMSRDGISSGTYSPSNYGDGDPLPPPAPEGPWDNTLPVFNGIDPNGTWRLFVDNPYWDHGQIGCGWQLQILVADPAANPTINSITCFGGQVRLQWNGTPGRRLQRSSSLRNPDWQNISESEGQNSIQLLMGTGPEFFRLSDR